MKHICEIRKMHIPSLLRGWLRTTGFIGRFNGLYAISCQLKRTSTLSIKKIKACIADIITVIHIGK